MRCACPKQQQLYTQNQRKWNCRRKADLSSSASGGQGDLGAAAQLRARAAGFMPAPAALQGCATSQATLKSVPKTRRH